MSQNHSSAKPHTGIAPASGSAQPEYQSAKGCLMLVVMGSLFIAICVVAAWLFGNFS